VLCGLIYLALLASGEGQDLLAVAENRMREVNNAYSVLMDPHERSWYDSHRDKILRGGAQI
jgi:DnaJ family protein A protein 5